MMAAVDIKVSVETVVIDVLRKLAEQVRDEFGIQLDSVAFEWIDTSTILAPRSEIGPVTVSMTQAVAK